MRSHKIHEHLSPRQAVAVMIRDNELEGLLRHAETIHGHRCPFLAMGVKAGRYAMNYLEQESTGMEEVLAAVECNNCFADGIQVVCGCTFGNNGLTFKDLGKTAVTVARRRDVAAVRLALRPDFREAMFARYPAWSRCLTRWWRRAGALPRSGTVSTPVAGGGPAEVAGSTPGGPVSHPASEDSGAWPGPAVRHANGSCSCDAGEMQSGSGCKLDALPDRAGESHYVLTGQGIGCAQK